MLRASPRAPIFFHFRHSELEMTSQDEMGCHIAKKMESDHGFHGKFPSPKQAAQCRDLFRDHISCGKANLWRDRVVWEQYSAVWGKFDSKNITPIPSNHAVGAIIQSHLITWVLDIHHQSHLTTFLLGSLVFWSHVGWRCDDFLCPLGESHHKVIFHWECPLWLKARGKVG